MAKRKENHIQEEKQFRHNAETTVVVLGAEMEDFIHIKKNELKGKDSYE